MDKNVLNFVQQLSNFFNENLNESRFFLGIV